MNDRLAKIPRPLRRARQRVLPVLLSAMRAPLRRQRARRIVAHEAEGRRSSQTPARQPALMRCACRTWARMRWRLPCFRCQSDGQLDLIRSRIGQHL